MQLDPEIAEFIKNVSESHGRPFEIMSINDMREETKKLALFFGDREEVYKVETRMVKSNYNDFLIRIYYPSQKTNLPIVLYFHAGGYIRGNLDLCDGICRRIANASSCIVISVNYRLAPEEVFPAALEDAYTALCWAHKYAEEFGGNRDCIAVAGDSSGGNLAAALTILARDKKGPQVKFQILLNPMLDYTFSLPSHQTYKGGYFITEEALHFYASQYLPENVDRKNPHISPYFLENFQEIPPALIITAECDPVRDEGVAYAEKLKAHQIPVTHYEFKGVTHGFFYLVDVTKKAEEACGMVASALQRFFKKAIDEAR